LAVVPVLHIITRLIVGGAQENTMLTAGLLQNDPRYQGRYAVDLISGAQSGSEGSLISEVQQRGIPLIIIPQLTRQISPLNDLMAVWKLGQHHACQALRHRAHPQLQSRYIGANCCSPGEEPG
jgi:hypothetical protein